MSITQTQETYRAYGTAKGWRIFIYLFTPLLIALFFSCPFWIKKGEWDGPQVGFVVGAWAFGLFLCYALYETIKGKHIITHHALLYEGAFRRKELPLDAILGYRLDQQYTHILSKTPAYPKIRIGYTSEGYEEIQQWLATHYPNLDEQEQQREEAAILEDYSLGWTTTEREAKLAQARTVARTLNTAGMATGAWLFLLPEPYEWAFTAGLSLPTVAALALFWHRGIIRPDEQKNSAYPSLAGVLFIPSLGLILRCLLDFELLAYSPIWPIAGMLAGAFGAVLLLGSREFLRQKKSRWSVGICVLAYALLYGYGATIAINCAFDSGTPQHYQAAVLSKHFSSGKTTTYYLHVTPWGPRTEAEDITVTEEHYQKVSVGSPVHVYRMPGRLRIPWFIATE